MFFFWSSLFRSAEEDEDELDIGALIGALVGAVVDAAEDALDASTELQSVFKYTSIVVNWMNDHSAFLFGQWLWRRRCLASR